HRRRGRRSRARGGVTAWSSPSAAAAAGWPTHASASSGDITAQPGSAEVVPLKREPVELGCVGAGDFVAVFGAGFLEVACNDLLRVRPGGGLVRVVGGPHQLVDTDELAVGDAYKVVDVGGPHLALE